MELPSLWKLNNYNCKYSCQICMKNEAKPVKEQKISKPRLGEPQEGPVSTKPLRSPSPDRRPANIIANTRSPVLQEIKKQITPIKQEATALKILQKIQYRQKYTTTPIETPRYSKEVYTTHDRQRQSDRTQDQLEEESTAMKEESKSKYHQGESRTQPRPQRPQQDTASQFQLRLSGQSRAGQLDYLRLLKEKEETIKQLRELLELIDRSNTSGYSEQNERVVLMERRLRQYSKQVKVLEIENQCLISVIENNHVNLPSNKEEILQREIRQLRESLSLAESEHSQEKQQAKRRIAALQADNKQLQRECDKLLKLMREREGMDKKESPLGSAHSLVSKDRQRVTLSKIKEQYNQNLRLAQENFENEYRDCYENFRKIVEKESSRIDYYMLRIQDLQQALQGQKKPNDTPQPHLVPEVHKIQAIHSGMPPHQEIESLLLQKYSKYMRQLDEEKKVNEKLNLELSIAWKSLRELEMRSFNTSQELSESQQDELSELSIRNSTLKNKVKELESANAALKRTLEELASLKAKQIKELEGKVEAIVELYEGRLKSDREQLGQKCEELQAFKAEAEAREQRMREDESHRQRIIEQKITAIIMTFQKEADIYRESLLGRASTINSLQEENQYLRGELQSILNSKEKQTDISKLSESERVIESLEGELKYARGRLQQAQERMVVAEEERKYYQRANADLQNEIEENREVAQAKISLLQKENSSAFQQLNNKSKELDECLRENKQLIESIGQKKDRIDSLMQAMTRLEELNREQLKELQQFRQRSLKMQGKSFEEELQVLKRSIVDFFAKYKEQSSGKDLQNYYTIQVLFEAKIDENVRLQQEVEDLKDSLNNQHREKGRLTERIANLEKNVGVYQQELKERRSLYEALLKEKSRIEKEIVLAKRIKDTQSGTTIEKMSSNVGEITGQIDKLVELERTRHFLISKLFVFE